MIYGQQINTLTALDIKLFTEVCKITNLIDNDDPKNNCHSICRAIAVHVRKLKVVDGHLMGFTTKPEPGLVPGIHTWLKTPDGAIIDPYPMGFMSRHPVLVVTKGTYGAFAGNLYFPKRKTAKSILTKKVNTRSKRLAKLIDQRLAWQLKSADS